MRMLPIGSYLFVLVSCGGAAAPTPAPAPVAAPAKETAEAPAVVTIRGRLRAHDGAPLRATQFYMYREGFTGTAANGALAEDGSFHAEVEPGVYMFGVIAVDHAQYLERLLIDRAVELQGDLGTHPREDPGEALPLKAEYLGADGEVLAAGPSTAARASDGIYRVDLKDRPKDAVKLRYQLVDASGRSYNGPLADTYERDDNNAYWSVVALAGRDALALDLAGMPPAGKAPQLTWSGEAPELVATREYRGRWRPRVAEIYENMPRKDGMTVEPGPAEQAKLAAMAAEALAEADAAATDDRRMLLRLAHLDLFSPPDEATQRTRTEWLLERVDPVDPRLGLFYAHHHLGFALRSADAALSARIEAWLARMQGNPQPDVALSAISILIHRADERRDDAQIAALYAVVREPRFAGTSTAKDLTKLYGPDRILQRGKPFPDFDFPALAAGGPPITRAERAGRLYLVEFWATWCGPCVAELPELHAAYAKIHGVPRGADEAALRRLAPIERPELEFVSVSFDERPDDVRKFREERWSMPWTHAFVGRDREKEVMDRFGFVGVPTTVLVDGGGTIVEVGKALRGERLLPTLERALAQTR